MSEATEVRTAGALDPHKRTVVAILGIALLALVCPLAPAAVPARAAAAKRSVRCDARKGHTLREDATARVFTVGDRVYACGRPGGRAYLLVKNVMKDGFGDQFNGHVEMAGRFVAFGAYLGGPSFFLKVIDLSSGKVRTAGSVTPSDTGSSIDDYVIDPGGSVVYVASYEQFHGCASDPNKGCSDVVETTALGTRTTLDHATIGQISSLAYSAAGRTVYWSDGGTARSAPLR